MAKSNEANGRGSASSGAGTVALRFDFYRDGFRASVALNLVMIMVIVVLIFMVSHYANRKVDPAYFTVDNAGRIVKQQAMDKPYLTEGALLAYAARAVSESYTFDADNYRATMTRVGEFFTPDGHSEFIDSMQTQIKYVVEHVLISSAVPQGTPVIINRGQTPSGVFAWKVRVPVVVTLRAKDSSSTVRRIVTLVIVNRPTFETPYGVGISSFSAKDV